MGNDPTLISAPAAARIQYQLRRRERAFANAVADNGTTHRACQGKKCATRPRALSQVLRPVRMLAGVSDVTGGAVLGACFASACAMPDRSVSRVNGLFTIASKTAG